MGLELGLRLGTAVLKVSQNYEIPYILLQELIFICLFIGLELVFVLVLDFGKLTQDSSLLLVSGEHTEIEGSC